MLNYNPFIGQRIAYQREKLGLNQADLASIVGIPKKYLSDIETGRKIPRINHLARIAAALDVTMDELNRRERYLWRS